MNNTQVKFTAPIVDDVTNHTMAEINKKYPASWGVTLKKVGDRVLVVLGAVTITQTPRK